MGLTEHLMAVLKKLGPDASLTFILNSDKRALQIIVTKTIAGDRISLDRFVSPMMITFSSDDVVERVINDEMIPAMGIEYRKV